MKVPLNWDKLCLFIAVSMHASIWHSLVKIDGLTLRLKWWACIMHHMHPNLNGTKLDCVGVKIELGSISAIGTIWAHCSLFWMMVKICSSRSNCINMSFTSLQFWILWIDIFSFLPKCPQNHRLATVLIAFCFSICVVFTSIMSKLLLYAYNIQRWALWHDLSRHYWQNS